MYVWYGVLPKQSEYPQTCLHPQTQVLAILLGPGKQSSPRPGVTYDRRSLLSCVFKTPSDTVVVSQWYI